MAEPTDQDDVPICRKCGWETPGRYFMCDRDDGIWCPKCWPNTVCGSGGHGEGCPTRIDYDGA